MTVPDTPPEAPEQVSAAMAVGLALVLPVGAVDDGHPVARMRELLAEEIDAARARRS